MRSLDYFAETCSEHRLVYLCAVHHHEPYVPCIHSGLPCQPAILFPHLGTLLAN